jgi:phosphoribosylpyrophosphate synthetase
MLDKLAFCSIFSYCPRDNSKEGVFAKKVRDWIKYDTIIKVKKPVLREGKVITVEKEMSMAYYVAERLKSLVDEGYFADFFQEDTILVPMPRSTPIKKGQLWPPYQIAKAMENKKLGVVVPLIQRMVAIQKSSYAPPSQRPKPVDHYNSMGINKMVDLEIGYVVFVDDIVTRGHTFMGAAWRLKEVYPDVEIKAFAAMQTISDKSKFKRYFYPAKGTITYWANSGTCRRDWESIG